MKLAVNDIIEVHGWVMLKLINEGTYKISRVTKVNGIDYYSFTTVRGRKIPIMHRTESVDAWLREKNHPDLNKIVKKSEI